MKGSGEGALVPWDLVRLGGGAPGSGWKKRKTAREDREGCDVLETEHWRGTVGL